MATNKKISLGIIGVGGQGEKIVNTILKTTNLKLAACFHYKKEKAEEFAKKYNCEPFDNLKKMLTDNEIKGVIIATPNHLHYKQIRECLKYKKHIFVEKPITNKLSEAAEVVKEARRKKLILMVGHNVRRNDAIRKIKQLMDSGKIGKLVSAEMNLSHAGGMKISQNNWRFYKEKCPGGPLIMLGIHMVDVSNYLFGEAKRVVSRVKRLYAPTETEDTCLLLVELRLGGIVYLCSNYNVPLTYFIRVYGTKGILEFNRNQGQITFQGMDIERKPCPLEYITYKENDTFLEEMEEFGNCIFYNKKPETGGPEAFNALAIIEAALESQNKNKLIEIKHL